MKSLSEKTSVALSVTSSEKQNIDNSDLQQINLAICEVEIKFRKLNFIQLCWVF